MSDRKQDHEHNIIEGDLYTRYCEDCGLTEEEIRLRSGLDMAIKALEALEDWHCIDEKSQFMEATKMRDFARTALQQITKQGE